MTQKARTAIFKAFRDLDRGVLLCTDVAARGLNLEGEQALQLQLVIRLII